MTIHLPQNTTLPELRRILELIQKQQTTSQVSNQTNVSGSGGGSAVATGTAIPGPTGPAGPAGADGVMDLDLIVTTYTETEDIIMESGNVITDQYGWAVTDTHTDWDIVEDEYGFILTAE